MIAPARRRLWSLFAVAGIVIGAVVLISGDRSGHHSIRLLGALIMAGGCLCAGGRLPRDSPRHRPPPPARERPKSLDQTPPPPGPRGRFPAPPGVRRTRARAGASPPPHLPP